MRKLRLKDSMTSGFLAGLILPVVVFLIVFLVSSGERTFGQYLARIEDRDVITHFMSLCVFPNVFAFLLFNRFDRFRSARGVLGMTIIWALAVFLIKML